MSEPRVPALLVVIGDQTVRLGMGRLLAEDLLRPPQALFGMAVFKEPAGGVVLKLNVARRGVQGSEDSGKLFLVARSRAHDLGLGQGFILPPQSPEDQTPEVMKLELLSVDREGPIE